MDIFSIKAPIIVSRVPNHRQVKEQVIASLDTMGTFSLQTPGQNLASTDWHVSSDIPRLYWGAVQPIVDTHIADVGRALDLVGGRVVNYWYQQYREGDYHEWHIHPTCMFSNVYFVDLPNGKQTTFKSFGEELQFAVQEGDILTFPSHLIHCSKALNTNATKTVLVFNSDYDSVSSTINAEFRK